MTDILIIGAGLIGLACAIEAKKAGLSYIVIEKGCLVNSLYNYPANMQFFSTADRLEIGDVPFISQQIKPNRNEALEYYRRVAQAWDLHIKLFEKVTQISRTQKGIEVLTEKGSYHGHNIVLSTGFYDLPYTLGIPGEELSKVNHYYSDPHPYFGMKVAIIGAANSAVDAALEIYRKGAKEVIMIVRDEAISPSVKYWVKPDIENRIKEGSIHAFFNSRVIEIRPKEIVIETPVGKRMLENDFVLAMTGYQPSYDLLEQAGVKIDQDEDRTPQYNPETMESTVSGVYLAGVVCGGLKTNKWFIENSRQHAKIIVADVVNKT